MKAIILLGALALVHGGTIEYTKNGCPRDYSIEKLLPHEDCKQFYQCLGGILIARPCPAGLYFDSNREICDWPQNTNCGDKHQDNINKYPENTEELDVSDPSLAPKICAAPKSNGILVAHEICNNFFKCSYGKPVALSCPLNLLYNPSKEQCDWPENVVCGNRVISETDDSGNDNNDNGGNETEEVDIDENIPINDDPSEAPAICKNEDSESVLVAHENCNQFYKCSQGLPVALECPLNLLYNPLKKYCDWPVNVDCGSRIIPENENTNNDVDDNKLKRHIREVEININSDPSQAPSICADENSEGILVAHENCNQFYKCSQGVPVALNCPVNLLYNPEKEYCDWIQNVDCENRLIPDSDSVNDSGSNNDNGNEVEDSEVEDNENGDPSEAPAICAAEDSDGILIAHENCNQFYKCFEGRPVALSCPIDLLYNPSKKYCDWAHEVFCGNRVIPEKEDDSAVDGGNGQEDGGNDDEVPEQEINDDPSKAPGICAAQGSDGVLVAHEICNKFYKCSEGLPVALLCPANLLYNPSKKYCDWPQNVECGDRSLLQEDNVDEKEEKEIDENKVEEIDYGIQAAAVCADISSNILLVSHENCDQFYKCAFGLPVAISCPSGLLYNARLEVCDWPANVECGNRDRRLQTERRYIEAKKALKFLLRVY